MVLLLILLSFHLGIFAENASETTCVCGNGIQEAYPTSASPCPYRLYGATAPSIGAASDLVYMNPYDGTGAVIATMTNIKDVTGLDFSPSGVLYAVGRNASNQSILATVDCRTGVATQIGLTTAPSILTAINFDSQGRLWAHLNTVTSRTRLDGFLGRIDIGTGTYTDVGGTGSSQIGNGIGFNQFPNELLYHAGGRFLSQLDQLTGSATTIANLLFFAPTHNHPRINDMDQDPLTNTMFVSIADNGFGINAPHENYLGTINLNTGSANFVKVPPSFAPVGLSAVTFNRTYETCDQGGVPVNELPLPDGTACAEGCFLTETNCADGLDNDFDGARDCADTDCDGATCIFFDGCTIDTCAEGACAEGAPIDCDDSNDCTNDSCNSGVCTNDISQTNSCDDLNPCTVDICSAEGFCESTNFEDGAPCDDESLCTQDDACLDGQCLGNRIPEDCDNGIDDNCDDLVDGDDPECANPVTIEDICDDGEDNDGDFLIDCEDPDCEGLPCMTDDNSCTDDVCSFGICEHFTNDLNACDDGNPCTDDQCMLGSCLGTSNDSNTCDDADACTLGDACSMGSCVGTLMVCDDDNSCTDDFCVNGTCSFDPLTGSLCESDDNSCTDDQCVNGVCTHTNDNTNMCSDGLACSSGDHCVDGVCTGTRGTETGANCSNGIDDDCDFLIDDLDPNCSASWLRVFVTRNTYDPDFGSAAAADAICQAAAISASRTGIFKAFVSSSISDAASRITNPNNKPWYLYTVAPNRIADNKADLLDGTIQAAINVDEYGVHASKNPKFVWTGSNADGTVKPDNTCDDWTTTKAKIKGTRGATDKIDYKWADQPDATCNQDYRLYCFQIEL